MTARHFEVRGTQADFHRLAVAQVVAFHAASAIAAQIRGQRVHRLRRELQHLADGPPDDRRERPTGDDLRGAIERE